MNEGCAWSPTTLGKPRTTRVLSKTRRQDETSFHAENAPISACVSLRNKVAAVPPTRSGLAKVLNSCTVAEGSVENAVTQRKSAQSQGYLRCFGPGSTVLRRTVEILYGSAPRDPQGRDAVYRGPIRLCREGRAFTGEARTGCCSGRSTTPWRASLHQAAEARSAPLPRRRRSWSASPSRNGTAACRRSTA